MKLSTLALCAGLSVVPALPVLGQAPSGMIHGHVQNPAGSPIVGAKVLVTTDGKTPKYTFVTDANGDYKGDGIAPGKYALDLEADGKPVDQLLNVEVVAGKDEVENFDLTRPEYLAKLTPEQRKQVEDVKKQNAGALKNNAEVKNLNGDLATARADNKAKNFADADALMTKDTTARPDASVLWLELGNAQVGEKKWPEATTSLQKAISIEAASSKPNEELVAGANNSLGEALAGQGKVPEAQAAYAAAAKALPAQAGVYYTNETIILARNNADGEQVAASADKAIAADPNKPLPYYLKGQALIAKASVDPKTSKITAPPGCAEAYQKYLELAPNGPYAGDAQNILASMGEKVKTSFHAGRK